MADLDAFARDCMTASKQLRRIPADLRRALASDVKTEVAAPLAAKISAAASGSYGRALAPQVKARASADPQIVIGGTKRIASGGASGRQLIYGTEFGGGSRVTAIPTRPGRRGHRRRTTRQFIRQHRPFVFNTIGRNGGWVLDRFAHIVDSVLGGFDGR